MPRRKRVPSYRLHKPSDQAVVTLDGRDFYLGKYDTPKSREAYARMIAEWNAARSEAEKEDRKPQPKPFEPSRSPTVNELLLAFWRHALEHYRKHGRPTSTLGNYRRVARLLKTYYGATDAADFSPKALKTCQQILIDEGLSRGTISDHTRSIRHMLNEVLLGAKGTNATDLPEFASSVIGFLKAFNLERNQKNIRKTNIGLAALVEGTVFEASDLSKVAPIALVLCCADVDPATARAGFTVLKGQGKLPPEQAATGLRNVVQLLSTSGGNPVIANTLEQIGDPELREKVDLVGESLYQVSFRLPASEKRLLALEAGRQGKSLSLIIAEQLGPFFRDLRAHEAEAADPPGAGGLTS